MKYNLLFMPTEFCGVVCGVWCGDIRAFAIGNEIGSNFVRMIGEAKEEVQRWSGSKKFRIDQVTWLVLNPEILLIFL